MHCQNKLFGVYSSSSIGKTRRASLYSKCAPVSHGHPCPCHCFTACPSLDLFWSLLTTVYQEQPTRPAVLEMAWPSVLCVCVLMHSSSWYITLTPLGLYVMATTALLSGLHSTVAVWVVGVCSSHTSWSSCSAERCVISATDQYQLAPVISLGQHIQWWPGTIAVPGLTYFIALGGLWIYKCSSVSCIK